MQKGMKKNLHPLIYEKVIVNYLERRNAVFQTAAQDGILPSSIYFHRNSSKSSKSGRQDAVLTAVKMTALRFFKTTSKQPSLLRLNTRPESR